MVVKANSVHVILADFSHLLVFRSHVILTIEKCFVFCFGKRKIDSTVSCIKTNVEIP